VERIFALTNNSQHKMKTILIFLSFSFCLKTYGQDIKKNFIGLQFGGQALVGFSYDRTLLNSGKLKLNGSIGVVINEYADDQDPLDRPVYGLNLGVIALYDLEYIFIEGGMFSSPYFYKSFTFINYYSWIGLRLNSRKKEGVFLSVGWTPSIYFSKSPPEQYNNIKLGLKVGANF